MGHRPLSASAQASSFQLLWYRLEDLEFWFRCGWWWWWRVLEMQLHLETVRKERDDLSKEMVRCLLAVELALVLDLVWVLSGLVRLHLKDVLGRIDPEHLEQELSALDLERGLVDPCRFRCHGSLLILRRASGS